MQAQARLVKKCLWLMNGIGQRRFHKSQSDGHLFRISPETDLAIKQDQPTCVGVGGEIGKTEPNYFLEKIMLRRPESVVGLWCSLGRLSRGEIGNTPNSR